MPRVKTNFEGGSIYTKHMVVGREGCPPRSDVGDYCAFAAYGSIGSGTVVGIGCKVRKAVGGGSNVTFGADAQVRGTDMSPVTFEEGTTFGPGADLRHVHFKRGVRFLGSAILSRCVLPSDTVFEDRGQVVISSCKKLKVDKPYQWPAAKPKNSSKPCPNGSLGYWEPLCHLPKRPFR